MILEWKEVQTIKPEETKPEAVTPEEPRTDESAPVAEAAPAEALAVDEHEPRHARSAEAAAWEARQAQAAHKTGLERPSRPVLAETTAHSLPTEPPVKTVEVLKPVEPKTAHYSTPVESKVAIHKPAAHKSSGFDRALQVARFVAPLLQRVLPLLSPGVATAAGAATLLLSQPSQPRASLQPTEHSLDTLSASQAELRDKLNEHATQLKGVSTQIQLLQELTEQRSAEQAELEQDVKSLRAKVAVLLWLIVALLVISITSTGYLVLHAFKLLP